MRIRVAVVIALAAAAPLARADKCVPQSKAEAASKDGRFKVTAARGESGWVITLEDTKNRAAAAKPLKGIESHAHMELFVTGDGERIVVFDGYAGTRRDHRLLVLDKDLNPVRSLGLKDILDDAELARVTESISHLHWLKYDEKKPAALTDDGAAFVFTVLSGRAVRVVLSDGRPAPK